jgi:aromatic-L-amino-acid/L-tryptophan decarboxylase
MNVSKAFRESAHRAMDLALDHLEGLTDHSVFQPMTPEERAAILSQPLPHAGCAPNAILSMAQSQILSHPMGNGHPRFFGYVNSPPQPMGVLGDLLAAAMNPSCAGGDHAAIYLERCCVR